MHVFCIFVFAPIQRSWACFTWKGALEIRSLLLFFPQVDICSSHPQRHRKRTCKLNWSVGVLVQSLACISDRIIFICVTGARHVCHSQKERPLHPVCGWDWRCGAEAWRPQLWWAEWAGEHVEPAAGGDGWWVTLSYLCGDCKHLSVTCFFYPCDTNCWNFYKLFHTYWNAVFLSRTKGKLHPSTPKFIFDCPCHFLAHFLRGTHVAFSEACHQGFFWPLRFPSLMHQLMVSAYEIKPK